MKDWLIEHKIFFISAIIITAGCVYYFYFYQPTISSVSSIEQVDEKPQSKPVMEPSESKQQPEKIIVDVKGQIQHPGVYTSNKEERVMDVVTRAGGLTEKADETQVNFAEHIHDEMVIYIPAKGEGEVNQSGSDGHSTMAGGEAIGKLDLNKADVNQLQTLPGIGPAKAASIIEYREKSGKFKDVEDLKNISGIGDKTFEKLKDLIVVH